MDYLCVLIFISMLLFAFEVKADQHTNESMKIFNGTTPSKLRHRYTVWLQKDGDPSCGGTLLSADWVLTAASCLTNIVRNNKLKIYIGDFNRATRKNEFRVKPAEIILHPGFNEDTLENNIGLLKLPKSAPLRRRNIAILPSLVKPEQDDGFITNSECYMTGWGQKQDGSNNKRLQLLDVRLLAPEECDNLDIRAKELCYTGTPGGACPSDEGSPIICKIDGIETQIGIHSKTKCSAASTTLTRVSVYNSWITSTVDPDSIADDDCGTLPVITNGIFINNGSNVGDTATILCDQGYRATVGATCRTQITCQESGQWSSTSVQCIEVCESRGTSFVFGYLRNAFAEGSPYLYITASESTQVQVTVPFLDSVSRITVTGFAAVELGETLASASNEQVSNRGVLVTSDKPISVYIHNYRPGNGPSADGSLIFPENCLANDYRVIAHDTGPDSTFLSECMVVGLQGDTSVAINLADGSIFNVMLNRYDTYLLRRIDVTGAYVVADKPVAMLAGHECGSVPNQTVEKCDHLIEMLPPTNSFSTQFIMTNFSPRPNYSVRIVADTDNTTVTVWDDVGNSIATFDLDSGQSAFTTITQSQTVALSSNLPVLVAQYGHGDTSDSLDYGDPSIVIIPGLDQFLKRYDISTPLPPDLYNRNWVYIVISDCYDFDGLLVNGDPLFNEQSTDPTSLSVPSLGVFYVISLEITESNTILTHTDNTATFGVIQYGFNGLVEYAWVAGRTLTSV